jgi:S1-C subfamily serine protease
LGDRPKEQGPARGQGFKIGVILMTPILLIAGWVSVKMIVEEDAPKQKVASESITKETKPTTSTAQSTPLTPEQVVPGEGSVNWNMIATSVVYVDGTNDADCPWAGSGTIVGDGSYVLTNAHVAIQEDGITPCKLAVGIISSVDDAPQTFYWAIAVEFDNELDLAVLRILDNYGVPTVIAEAQPMELFAIDPRLGDELTVIGFPGMGGSTTTLTSGNYAGLSDDSPPFFKTSAIINHGNSGGATFDKSGNFIGVPTAAVSDSQGDISNSLGLIRPLKYAIPMLDKSQGDQPAELNFGITTDVEPSDSVAYIEELDPRFDTCGEANSNGYGPYVSGIDPEYDWYRDRDGDGIVCERR